MHKEFIGASTILWCIVTYWAGGQQLPVLGKGFKWIRRFGLPIGLFIGLAWLRPDIWYLALLACTLLCGALHLGYNTNLWLLPVTGLAMGAPALVLGGFGAWEIGVACLPMLVHTIAGLLSRTSNRFGWSWVALAMGWAIGVAYVYQAS